MKIKALILAAVCILLFACANIFEPIADKDSKEAKAEELELALENHDYQKIIGQLDGDAAHLQKLSLREKYLLQMAWIGKTGFTAISILDTLFDDNSANTSNILIQSFASKDKQINTDDYNKKNVLYVKARDMNGLLFNPTQEKNISTASGIAASLDMLMSVTHIAKLLNPGIPYISFDSNDPNYIGDIFKGKYADATALETAINGAFPNALELQDFLDNMQTNVTSLGKTIEQLIGQDDSTDISKKLDEYLNDFETGVNSTTFATFIWNQWVN